LAVGEVTVTTTEHFDAVVVGSGLKGSVMTYQAGERLGPVGGRIVGEVLTTLIDRDPGSFRGTAPDGTPTLPAARPGQFGLADLLMVTMEVA
jgi:hypothetical protein